MGVNQNTIDPAQHEQLLKDFPGEVKRGPGSNIVITSVDGQSVATDREVTLAIGRAEPGREVELGILRGSDEMSVHVTLTPLLTIPGLENLPPALLERLRELAESGNLTPEQLRRFAMGQNFAYGTVKEISDTSLTVTRLDGALQPTNDLTFTLDSTTQYRSGAASLSRTDVTQGATVAVISLDGEKALVVLVLQR